MEYFAGITHDKIKGTYCVVHCLRSSGVANFQIFDFPIDLRRRPYNIVTLPNV